MPFYSAPDGTRLHYLDEGEGLPVLALAGLTRNAADFDHIAPLLDGIRLIRPDYRGRGKSDWATSDTYTVPHEAQDILALMDHLGLEKAAIIGTSRGGIIGMVLAATAKDRLMGVALNDIGPVIDAQGLDIISAYVGRNPAQKTYEEAAQFRDRNWVHFKNVPMERWLAEVRAHYEQTADGLVIRYDPKLRDTFNAADNNAPSLWPFFDALDGLPIALIRGMNSDLLSVETADEMSKRRPDMIRAEVPDRGHVPFLDEPEAIEALRVWLSAVKDTQA